MTRSELQNAYLATSFFADTPNGRVCIRIGRTNGEVDRLLDQRGLDRWCFITAYNPASQASPESENRARQTELEREVRDRGLEFFSGEGKGDDGNWPPEPSILIIGIGRVDAESLGRRYGQNAIVCGVRGQAAELVWMNGAEAER